MAPAETLYHLGISFLDGSNHAAGGPAKKQANGGVLPTLTLVVDGSGFVRGSQLFQGQYKRGVHA